MSVFENVIGHLILVGVVLFPTLNGYGLNNKHPQMNLDEENNMNVL